MLDPFSKLQSQIDKLTRALKNLQQASSRSEVTGARVAIEFADLPTTGAVGSMYWVSDGRKPGEGAGNGTGVPASWNQATLSWISDYDQNTVVA